MGSLIIREFEALYDFDTDLLEQSEFEAIEADGMEKPLYSGSLFSEIRGNFLPMTRYIVSSQILSLTFVIWAFHVRQPMSM